MGEIPAEKDVLFLNQCQFLFLFHDDVFGNQEMPCDVH